MNGKRISVVSEECKTESQQVFNRYTRRTPLLALAVLSLLLMLTVSAGWAASPGVDIGEWSDATSLPQAVASRNLIEHEGVLYLIGGQNSQRQSVSTVRMADINADGSLDAWQTTASLPRTLYLHSASASNTHLYVVGGWDGDANDNDIVHLRDEVLRAPFLAGGGLGAWEEMASTYPRKIDLHQSVIVDNTIYVLGGWNGTSPLAEVYYADLDDLASSASAWTRADDLPKALRRLSAVAVDGYIYVSGGFNSSAESAVYYAKVNPDGSLGAWQTAANPLPQPLFYHESVMHDGRLVVLGGRSGAVVSSVYSSVPGSNGAPGEWTQEPSLPQAVNRFGAASYTANGSDMIFVAGGLNSSSSQVVNVYNSNVPQPPTPTPTVPPSSVIATLSNDPSRWVAPGEEIEYMITYQRIGRDSVVNVVIEEDIPNNVELIAGSISNGGIVTRASSGAPDSITWTFDELSDEQAHTLSYRVRRLPPPTPSVQTALAISASGPAQGTANQPLRYEATVTNTVFSLTLQNLTVSCLLPEGASYVEGSGGTLDGDRIVWTLDSLTGVNTTTFGASLTSATTLVFGNCDVVAGNGANARSRDVVVTQIGNTPPPPTGDGVFIINQGALVSWQTTANATSSTRTNDVRNPALRAIFIPVILK